MKARDDRWRELGIELDPVRNEQARGVEARISTDGSRVQVWVVPTNEELVVAREVRRHLEARDRAVPATATATA